MGVIQYADVVTGGPSDCSYAALTFATFMKFYLICEDE